MVVVDGDMYAHRVVGQQGLYQLGPLDETGLSAVEVVFVADVIDLCERLDAVEVEMIENLKEGEPV